MRTIWKWPLQIIDEPQTMYLPEGAKVVHVEVQEGELCIWVEADTSAPSEARSFTVEGTGHPIPDGAEHVGTALIDYLVWHVYEVRF